MSVPSHDQEFKCHMWLCFLCLVSSVIVRVVDIDRIDDHHCLDFLFIINLPTLLDF